ncbi:hypothetical protein SLEP1_g54352 [Rubroshorea leprosula]|uniref:Neutral ceramidase n=1 Tax=Rubroshorea leprosula TaxID=152421 RepID=A0AAV5MCE2_9ROSI|nr:hypothetical protein SLEP1_g54352 [Rubroshorea leprosula]
MTGPAAGVNMMGYANMDQISAGIHFWLRARNFIVAESSRGPRFAFVNLDAGMASQLVTIKVLKRLKLRYPNEVLSTKIIGERQFQKTVEPFSSATNQLTGRIDYRQVYLNSTNIEVELDGNTVVKTCPVALGVFLPELHMDMGSLGFNKVIQSLMSSGKKVRDLLKEPSQYQVDCQKPKAVLLDTEEMFEPYAWALFFQFKYLRLGKLIILSVPGSSFSFMINAEFTTRTGRRLREAVKETLISTGNGEFDDETHVIIAGLTNTYSQYVATFEEYVQQRHEAASTLYDPHTLSAYIQELKKLAEAMAKGKMTLKTLDLSSVQLSLLPDPSEGTFAVVEMFQGEWGIPVYDDDDFSLKFKWKVDNVTFYGLATLEWEVLEEASPAVYRFRHFGSSMKTKDSPTSTLLVHLVHLMHHRGNKC